MNLKEMKSEYLETPQQRQNRRRGWLAHTLDELSRERHTLSDSNSGYGESVERLRQAEARAYNWFQTQPEMTSAGHRTARLETAQKRELVQTVRDNITELERKLERIQSGWVPHGKPQA